MKFQEIIAENKKIDEAPMGLLKTAGHSVMSKVSPTSAGKLETGKVANTLYNNFKQHLGKTGEAPEADVVLAFLKSQGIPTTGAEAIIASAGDEQPSAMGQAAKAAAGDAIDAVSGAAKKAGGAVKSMAAKGMDKLKGAMAGKPADQGQAADRQEPNLDEPAGNQPAGNQPADAAQEQPANKLKSPYSDVSYNRSTGFDKDTMKNKSEPMNPGVVGGVPSTSSPLNALTPKSNNAPSADAEPQAAAGRKQGGGKVAGQLSQTPGAVKKRERRAAAKASTSNAIGQFVKAQTGKNPIRMKAGESIEYHFDRLIESLEYNHLNEALSKGTLDKIFLAAAQDAAKAGINPMQGGGAQGGGAQGGQGGGAQGGQGGGFMAGLKQGWQGGGAGGGQGDEKLKGTVNVGQLANLLQMDPKELAAALIKVRQGQPLSRSHVNTLSNAFVSMYKADPQTTVRIANMLKRVTVDQQ